MNPIAQAAALLAAAVHVFIFILESVRFTEPATYRRFFVQSQRDAELLRPIFFNQGFYNLFLAIGAAGGILVLHLGYPEAGRALVLFACGSMALAGLILMFTDRRFVRAGLLQAVPPIVALVFWAL
jgi:putative membrane protein